MILNIYINISFCATAFVLITLASCERLHEQIYSSIEGGAACFRRLNGTHQAGCSTSDKGSVGVVHLIRDIKDAQWMVHNATAGPYMGIVSTSLFNDIVELLMGYPENVAGVLIYDNGTVSDFSQESKCPNEYTSDQGSQCSSTKPGGEVWNRKGTGLLRRDIPFPLFYLPQSNLNQIEKIEQCHDRYNSDRTNQEGNPLCSVQLSSFMYAAVNTAVCLRRSTSSSLLTPIKVCDPLGDLNVYYSLFPRGQETKATKKPVIFVTARIDTASLFDGISPAAASSVVGMVTLISAASLLSKMIPVADAHLYDQNVLWTLFNGEAFDYIGSQRVAFDLSREAWPPVSPLSPSDIRLHVEIGQIGGSLHSFKDNDSWPLFAFAPYTSIPTPVSEFLNLMSININEINSTMPLSVKLTKNLPPSSLHSFRRILKDSTENGELLELLLVDHGQTFTNTFYHSVLDSFDKIDFVYHNISISSNGTFISTEELLANGTMKSMEAQVKISRLSTVLARTLYRQITKKSYDGNLTSSAHLVDEMLYCFLKSQACRLLIAADYAQSGGEELLPDRPAPLYVGVTTWPLTAPVFAGHLLALLAGTHLSDNRTECDARKDPGFAYYWLRGWNHSGVCIQTTMNFSQALSPAFILSEYDFTSGMYSTWTESVWQAMWARVFVAAGGGGARAAAIAGAFSTLIAAVLTYWLQKHSQTLFNTPSIVNNDVTTGLDIEDSKLLEDGSDAIKADQEEDVPQEILALKCLRMAVVRHSRIL